MADISKYADKKLKRIIVLITACFVIFFVAISFPLKYMIDYHFFKVDMQESFMYSRTHSSLTCCTHDKPKKDKFPADLGSFIYEIIVDHGAGRVCDVNEYEHIREVHFEFGDGSKLNIYGVNPPDDGDDKNLNMLIQYFNQEGEEYTYINTELYYNFFEIYWEGY